MVGRMSVKCSGGPVEEELNLNLHDGGAVVLDQ